MRNCTRDEGGPFGFGNQVLISSHRKLLRSEAVVVSVAETPGRDSGRHGRERRAQANRCRSVLARPTLPRPPHPAPTFVTMANAPPRGRNGAACKCDLG